MKLYYSVNLRGKGFPVAWIDQHGNQQIENFGASDPAQARREFEIAHPGAEFLTLAQFNSRLVKIERDRQHLAAWKEGRAIR